MLQKTRVYSIPALEELLKNGTSLLQLAIDVSKVMEAEVVTLTNLYSQIPSEAQVASFQLQLSLMQGMGLLNKGEFTDTYGRMQDELSKLITYIPDCDTQIAGKLLEICDITKEVDLKVAALRELIGSPVMGSSYEAFLTALKPFQDFYNSESGISARIDEILNELKGLESEYCAFSIDPVNLATGNFAYDTVDMTISGSRPLVFKRIYNSIDTSHGIFGKNWTHNHCVFLKKDSKSGSVTVQFEDSHQEVFSFTQKDVYISNTNKRSILRIIDGDYHLRTPDFRTYLFQHAGKCSERTDKSGSTFRYLYEGDQLIRITNMCGEYTLRYRTDGLAADIKDGAGRIRKYHYSGAKLQSDAGNSRVQLQSTRSDADVQLQSVESDAGVQVSYQYDELGRLTYVNNAEGIGVRNVFDSMGRTVSQTFPDGGVMKYEYLDEKNTTVLTEQNGNRIEYVHDPLFRNTTVIYDDGKEITKYNAKGRRSSFTDKNGNETKYEYNVHGDLITVTDALGGCARTKYSHIRKPLSVIQKDQSQKRNIYDRKGRLIKSIDELGRAIIYRYAKASHPSAILFGDGSKYEMTYDERENTTSITNAMGYVTRYEYDSLNRVARTTDPKGNDMYFEYDQNHRIKKVTNASGDSRYYEYNMGGSLIRLVEFDGSKYSMEYNEVNRLSMVTDALGGVTRYEYDYMWKLKAAITADGARTGYRYNMLGRLVEAITDDGASKNFRYDPQGNLTSIIHPDGTEIRYEYDALNRNCAMVDQTGARSVKEIDIMGRVTRSYDDYGRDFTYTYDAAGQLTAKTDSQGNTISMTYNAIGKIDSYRDISGNLRTYHYYPGGKLRSVVEPSGRKFDYTYDENGSLRTKTTDDAFTVTYTYDALNRLTEILDSGSRSKKYEYDAMNNLTAETDENGSRTEYSYLPMGRMSRTTDALGNVTKYDYDIMGRLTGIFHPDQDENSYEEAVSLSRQGDVLYKRDSLGRIVSMADAQGSADEFEYDCLGRLLAKTDRSHNRTDYRYSRSGRIDKISYADGKSAEYVYNELQQLVQVNDWLGTTNIAVDSFGRPGTVTDPNGQTVKYEYNNFGQRTALTYPNDKRVEYSYDPLNRLTGLKSDDVDAVYRYGLDNRLTEKSFSNGTATRFSHNEWGQITELTHLDADGILDHLEYAFDDAGNKTRVRKFRRDLEEESGVFDYEYDALNRLTSVTHDGTLVRKYEFDRMGNRTNKQTQGDPVLYTYDRNNRLTGETNSEGSKKYSYDLCGNLLSVSQNDAPLHTYRYDAAGRMVYADGTDITYNAFGNKTADTDGTYVVDITRRYHNTLMKNRESFVWDGSILSDASGVFMQDEQGSPLRQMDKTGQSLDAFAFDEYGRKTSYKAPRFGYNGYETAGNDLYYAQARHYQPSLGRFTSRDKIKGSKLHPYTMNEYSYVFNNPLKYVDLDGNWPSLGDIGDAIGDVGNAIGDAGSAVADTVSDGIQYVASGDLAEDVAAVVDSGVDYAADAVDAGIDCAVDVYNTGAAYVQNSIINPAVDFVENTVLPAIDYFRSTLDCAASGNWSMYQLVKEWDRASGGLLDQTIRTAASTVASLDIPGKLKTLSNFVPGLTILYGATIYLANEVLDTRLIGALYTKYLPIAEYGLGFTYDPVTDTFYSNEGSGQQQSGYGYAYDNVSGLLGMDLEVLPVVFQYDGKEYLLEPWLGKYGGGLSTGCEIGLYSRSKAEADANPYVPHPEDKNENVDIIYDSAVEEDQLIMAYTLYDANNLDNPILSQDTQDDGDDGDSYWQLTMKMGVNTPKDDLVMVGSLQHEDHAFLEAMRDQLLLEHIKAEIRGNTLFYVWDPSGKIPEDKEKELLSHYS